MELGTRSTPEIAERLPEQLREASSARADGFPSRRETHAAELLYRRAAGSPSMQSHLFFEIVGTVSAEYRAALVAEFEHRLAKAREAAPAFSMLTERDRLPTMQWSKDFPARVRVDIYTTGGAKLWAFERLVQTCFERAAERVVESPAQTVTPTLPPRQTAMDACTGGIRGQAATPRADSRAG